MSPKYRILLLSLLLDGIGMLSLIIPFIDVVWSFAAAYIMTRLYAGKQGKIAAAVAFVEEALPFLDIVPTFTIMWFYTYVLSSDKNVVETTIDID